MLGSSILAQFSTGLLTTGLLATGLLATVLCTTDIAIAMGNVAEARQNAYLDSAFQTWALSSAF